MVENYEVVQSKYDGSWRKMWLLRPRIRTDGKIYFLMKMVKYSCSISSKYIIVRPVSMTRSSLLFTPKREEEEVPY